MFWRFGSVDDRRPVAATVWLNEVWMRPVSGWISSGSGSTYVESSFASARCSRIFAGSGWTVASLFSASTSSEMPVLPFAEPLASRSCRRSNSTSRSWIGELMLNGTAGELVDGGLGGREGRAVLGRETRERGAVDRAPRAAPWRRARRGAASRRRGRARATRARPARASSTGRSATATRAVHRRPDRRVLGRRRHAEEVARQLVDAVARPRRVEHVRRDATRRRAAPRARTP